MTLESENKFASLKDVSPDFSSDLRAARHFAWVNEVSFAPMFDDNSICTTMLNFGVGASGTWKSLPFLQDRDSSIVDNRLILLCGGKYSSRSIRLESPEEVARKYFLERNYHLRISSAGRTCSHLIKRLGSLYGVKTLGNIDLIKLLDACVRGASVASKKTGRHNTNTRDKTAKRFLDIGDLKRAVKSNSEALSELVDSGIFKFGFRVTCTECGEESLYSLSDLNDEIHCQRCLSTFPASRRAESYKGGYKPDGVFAIENHAKGSYSVALALRFLRMGLGTHGNYVPSIEFEEGGSSEGATSSWKGEADFLLWTSDGMLDRKPVRILFGECKSFNTFKKEDVLRASQIVNRFPGCVFVFATLRPELSKTEVRSIRAFARRGRRARGDQEASYDVIVLTEAELTSPHAPAAWLGVPDRRSVTPEGLIDTAIRVTQILYLGESPNDFSQPRFQTGEVGIGVGRPRVSKGA